MVFWHFASLRLCFGILGVSNLGKCLNPFRCFQVQGVGAAQAQPLLPLKAQILPQILGSLPEVIRSCCHHHHHHHHHTRSSRGRFEWSARFHRPSRRVAGPGKRHSARGTPRAQPRDVRSAGRDTWNLTGEALGGPRKRSWRRCSRARSGSRSAIRGAHSGALDRPEPSDPAARAPICTSAPYSAADASGSSCAAGARLR